MRKEDVRIGMKVVPFKKSMNADWSTFINHEGGLTPKFFKRTGYLIVQSQEKMYCELSGEDGRDLCCFFYEDFKPYIEPKQTQKETQQMKKEEHAQLNKREKGRKVKELREKLGIKRMLRNGDALIVWFEDGTEKGHKVVEKCVGKDEFDIEIGISLAYLHHIAGSKSVFKEAVEKEVKTKLTVVKGE